MSTCGCDCHSDGAGVRGILMDEHRVIERVLDAVERMIQQGAFDRRFLEQAIDFFRNFADGCHHAKEEGALFPELQRAGLPREGGPIACMLHEHDEGRAYIRAMLSNLEAAERGEPVALASVRQAAAQYVVMLRQHIQKEDNVLFVMAENLLSPEQKQKVLADFDHAEHEPHRAGKHEQYVRLADALSNWRFVNPEVCVR